MTTTKQTCDLCGLPFKAAISAVPLIAGAVAGTIAGCTGENCSPGRRILRGAIAGGLTAAGTVGLQTVANRACRCSTQSYA